MIGKDTCPCDQCKERRAKKFTATLLVPDSVEPVRADGTRQVYPTFDAAGLAYPLTVEQCLQHHYVKDVCSMCGHRVLPFDEQMAHLREQEQRRNAVHLETWGWNPDEDVAKDGEVKVTFTSGATSTRQSADYTLIPPLAIKRMAERFSLGAERHGRNNWRTALSASGSIDEEFRRARISHLIEHALKYAAEGNKGDDNLGAILWAAATLSEMEEKEPWQGNEGGDA